jgi:hypothetical protein
MKTSRFPDSQTIAIPKQAVVGNAVPELCREHGIGNARFHTWRQVRQRVPAKVEYMAHGEPGRAPAN